jgi:hypothetical protein
MQSQKNTKKTNAVFLQSCVIESVCIHCGKKHAHSWNSPDSFNHYEQTVLLTSCSLAVVADSKPLKTNITSNFKLRNYKS